MININYEFRKGIFFIRLLEETPLIDNINDFTNIKNILEENQFKYIVININHINKINNDTMNNIIDLFNFTHKFSNKLVICDKNKEFINNLKYSCLQINEELEVL